MYSDYIMYKQPEEFKWDFKESFVTEEQVERAEMKLNNKGIVTSIEYDGKKFNLYVLNENKRPKNLNTVKTGRF